MGFEESIAALAQRIPKLIVHLETEEATKNALVMPFIAALGYDVFNPEEVKPEYTADVGTKKGEKVDYAIIRSGEIVMLIECKKASVNLAEAEMSQLYRYFTTTRARIGVLTNGIQYRVYSDLDDPNVMDAKPFLELDLTNLRDNLVLELKKLSKESFDLDKMIDAASELKNLTEIKRILQEQFDNPDEDFVKLLFTRSNPGKRFNASIKEPFTELVKKAYSQILSERVSNRLRSALEKEVNLTPPEQAAAEGAEDAEEEDDGIITTPEELEGFHIVRAIICQVLAPERVVYKDTKSYFSILLDNHSRKPICRLWFNRKQKYIGLFDEKKKETRIALETITDIYKHAEQLKQTALGYDDDTGEVLPAAEE